MFSRKQKIKKLLLLVALISVLAGFLVAPAVLALTVGLEYGTATGLGAGDLRVTVMNVVRVFLGFLGVLAVVLILYAGFLWLTSAGNEEKISTAKKVLINAVIGLAIILLSFAIASFIINQLIIAIGAGQVCAPNECSGCYARCQADGSGSQYDATCVNLSCALPPPPATCAKPQTPKPTICAVKTPQSATLGGLPQGKIGDYVTLEGWYFGDYSAGTSKVDFEDTAAPVVACDGNPLWYENPGNNYGLVRVKVPAGLIVLKTYEFTLINNSGVASEPSLFWVAAGTAGPQLACLMPPAGINEQVLTKAEGENFGAAAGQLVFFNEQTAVFESWAEALITKPIVPPVAISGDVKVKNAANIESNGVYFTVACQTNANCSSQCCQNFSCQPASACLPGAGENCLVPAGNTCAASGQCQPGLICDDNSCQCRLPGLGENCDLTEAAACSPGACADDLVCGQSSCLCEAAPYISAVAPNDGALGNLITISGKQFGSAVGGVLFGTQPAQLASQINAECLNSWTDNQIIIVVPAGLSGSTYIRVIAADGKFDSTNDTRGPQIPDFTVNTTVRPGLCQITPAVGAPNEAVTLQGINFSASGQAYFAQAQAGGALSVSPDGKTITGATVPAMSPASVGVRVLNGTEYSNPLSFSVLAAPAPPSFDCSGNSDSCAADQTRCPIGQYCDSACQCIALTPCDGNPQTPACDPGGSCNAGYYCDQSCYCQPALPCDNDATTPVCDVVSGSCPTNYICDPSSNCTCQKTTGIATDSTYGWSFVSGKQPGACSSDEGVCAPDSTRCQTGYTCNQSTCNCDLITTYPCSSDPSHLTCQPDNTQCQPAEYCNISCECAPRINCDGTPETPACAVDQTKCPAGWYCQDDCYCSQGILCDNPALPADPAVSSCHPDSSYCPTNYFCDTQSNCTCRPSLGVLVDSAYAWTFSTFSPRPHIVEMCNRTEECRPQAISSPAPYSLGVYNFLDSTHLPLSSLRPDDGAVPIDAVVAFQFDRRMNTGTLNGNNLILAECNQAGGAVLCSGINNVPHAVALAACNYQNHSAFNSHCVKLIPENFLKPGYYYRILLKSDSILGENGLSLAGNYSAGGVNYYEWFFQTRAAADLSQLACLYLQPGGAVLSAYDQRQNYSAFPAAKDFWCVDIRPESCDFGYGWSAVDPNSGPPYPADDSRAQIVPTASHPAGIPLDEYDASINDHKAKAAAEGDTTADQPNAYTKIKAVCRFSDSLGQSAQLEGFSNLTVDFTSPRVIDQFPDCGAACLNTRIGATFSAAMNDSSVANALNLYICHDDPTCAVGAGNIVSTFHKPTAPSGPPEAPNTYIGDVDCFDYSNDGKIDYCLLPDTYYRVVIADTARSDAAAPKPLVGLNYDADGDGNFDSYSWIFKTQTNFGLCLPEQIDVAPAEKQAPKEVEIFYAARPKTKPDACEPDFGQRLNPYFWDWVWASTVPEVADLAMPGRDACGNYVKEAGEDCDDGNVASGDGCSAVCLNEGTSAPACGNGKIDPGEECDPPNSAIDCGNNCLWLGNANTFDVCGNSLVEPSEECDPPGPGCANNCLLSGSVLGQALCGDGQIGLGEECDDNDLASGDKPVAGDGCSVNCLIEDHSQSFCRSNFTNIFDFAAGPCIGGCEENYTCLALNTATGNTSQGSICADGLTEAGEECDSGGYCADEQGNPVLAANNYPKYCNTYGTFCSADQICRAFEGYCRSQTANTLTSRPCNTGSQCASNVCWPDGCSQTCINNGSVYEAYDPPNAGPYQIVETRADGETFIQANIFGYAPPLGQGRLTVGTPPGKFGIIDHWPGCSWACLNSDIGGQFNQSADPATLDETTDNVLLYECGANEACDIAGRLPVAGAGLEVYQTDLNSPNDTFRITLPPAYNAVDNDNNPLTPLVPALIPNTYYRAVVRNAVITADSSQHLDTGLNYNDPGFTPAGGDQATIDSFSWVFKTQPEDDLCALDRVEVIPGKLTLSEGLSRYIYFARPWALLNPQCSPNRGQRLNPYHYNWRWDDAEAITGQNGADLLMSDSQPLPTTPTEANELNLRDGCGNGILEPGEDCDFGLQTIPNCLSDCQWDTANKLATCGNGKLEAGEQCDGAASKVCSITGNSCASPCPGGAACYSYCSANCYWTGTGGTAGLSVCGNGKLEAGEACDTGDEPDNDDGDGCTDICTASGAVPASDSLCGDGQITKGEECDSGELANNLAPVSGDGCTGINDLAGHSCSGKNQAACQNISNIRWCYWTGNVCKTRPGLEETSVNAGNSKWHLSVCGNGLIEPGEECDDGNLTNGYCSANGAACSTIGAACGNSGQCLADGCGLNCLNNGSIAHDNRIDPYQIIQTVVKLPSAVSAVKEEIRAWYKYSPERVGVGELTVVSGAEIPFAVIGHQPAVNDINQCPNAALWAVFSKPLDLATVKDNFILCQSGSGCAGKQNLISAYSYRPVSGACSANKLCGYGAGELAGFSCGNDADCLGSQLLITRLNTQTGFLDANKNYYFDVAGVKSALGYCGPTRQVCQTDADCGGAAGSCIKGLESPAGTGREQTWTFGTGDTFCVCNYVGVKVDYTSGGAETTRDFYACARDNCGEQTPYVFDNDYSASLPGNQHLYTALCWDVANFRVCAGGNNNGLTCVIGSDCPGGSCSQGARMPVSSANITFDWLELDPDDIIFKTDKEAADVYNDQYYFTPGQEPNTPKGKNGRAQARANAGQYQNNSGQFCAVGTADCAGKPSASQNVAITNFICDHPWPEISNFPYRDNQSNGQPPNTNFEMYYCRDFGQTGLADDLPALDPAGPVLGTKGEVLKEFIFPVSGSSDALGIRVLKNPLHLSPLTWYQSGLCGGQVGAGVQNLCYADADCAGHNLFYNPEFAADWSGWEKVSAAPAVSPALSLAAGRTGQGVLLSLITTGGWGAQLVNDAAHEYILPAGNYVFSAYVKSGQKVYLGVEERPSYVSIACLNADCDGSKRVCSRQSNNWERLTCNFSLTQSKNIQFIVRLKDQNGSSVVIDDLRLSASCQKNVPDAGAAKVLTVDGYSAVSSGRSVYAGAANRLFSGSTKLYSDIYLISYSQGATGQTQEIFSRILDQTGQQGQWYFNADFTNNRVCGGDIGLYENTETLCQPVGYAKVTVCRALNNDRNACENAKSDGCYWSSQVNGCLARVCRPIYCQNNFDCPNLACDAAKEQVVRDEKRFEDLREIQLRLKSYGQNNRDLFPALVGGTYLSGLTFSTWPSWQETLGQDLGTKLLTDPLNRFKGCADYFCDENKNGKIDGGEDTSCIFGEISACGNQPKFCSVKDPDQEKTCWDEIGKAFSCPTAMNVYAYRSANNANDYELYTKFEYSGAGQWSNGNYSLPLSCVNKLNFKADKEGVFAAAPASVDCSASGGDADFDGVCDNSDNCPPDVCAKDSDCYNPEQRDSNEDGLGDECDSLCFGDKDGDGFCDSADNCPNVANLNQTDGDSDGYGDACDPCTDIDGDGWWDVKTGATDEKVCKKDDCPKYLNWAAAGALTTISSDHRGYCGNNLLKACAADSDCGAGNTCDFSLGSYNPYQEDYDNDGVGYICDFCLDFDGDNFGDYTFYQPIGSWNSLTADQKEHFQGCQAPAGTFHDFSAASGSNKNDLDNCPGGSGGAGCFDKFGIKISCKNDYAVWADILGASHALSERLQPDYNLNNQGDICDLTGNGAVDAGEECDCGTTGAYSSDPKNPFVCASKNGVDCRPAGAAYDAVCCYWCDNTGQVQPTALGGCCGDGETDTDAGEECDWAATDPVAKDCCNKECKKIRNARDDDQPDSYCAASGTLVNCAGAAKTCTAGCACDVETGGCSCSDGVRNQICACNVTAGDPACAPIAELTEASSCSAEGTEACPAIPNNGCCERAGGESLINEYGCPVQIGDKITIRTKGVYSAECVLKTIRVSPKSLGFGPGSFLVANDGQAVFEIESLPGAAAGSLSDNSDFQLKGTGFSHLIAQGIWAKAGGQDRNYRVEMVNADPALNIGDPLYLKVSLAGAAPASQYWSSRWCPGVLGVESGAIGVVAEKDAGNSSWEKFEFCRPDGSCCARDNQCAAGEKCCGGVCRLKTCELATEKTDCDDKTAATNDLCINSGDFCEAFCYHEPITACLANDGYCPEGCAAANDSDCGKLLYEVPISFWAAYPPPGYEPSFLSLNSEGNGNIFAVYANREIVIGSWEKFKLISAEGKSGLVKNADLVYIWSERENRFLSIIKPLVGFWYLAADEDGGEPSTDEKFMVRYAGSAPPANGELSVGDRVKFHPVGQKENYYWDIEWPTKRVEIKEDETDDTDLRLCRQPDCCAISAQCDIGAANDCRCGRCLDQQCASDADCGGVSDTQVCKVNQCHLPACLTGEVPVCQNDMTIAWCADNDNCCPVETSCFGKDNNCPGSQPLKVGETIRLKAKNSDGILADIRIYSHQINAAAGTGEILAAKIQAVPAGEQASHCRAPCNFPAAGDPVRNGDCVYLKDNATGNQLGLKNDTSAGGGIFSDITGGLPQNKQCLMVHSLGLIGSGSPAAFEVYGPVQTSPNFLETETYLSVRRNGNDNNQADLPVTENYVGWMNMPQSCSCPDNGKPSCDGGSHWPCGDFQPRWVTSDYWEIFKVYLSP